MKKIDLHIHTQKCKQGDGKEREIVPDKFIKMIHDNKIGICSITNHNKFDLEEYNYISKKEINFLIFPGIELDIDFEEGIRHIILVCNPKYAEKFFNVFSKDDCRDYDKFTMKYNSLISKINEFDKDKILIIPHFLDKDKKKSINFEEKEKLKNDLEGYTVILEPKLKTMGIINSHNEVSLIGSDVKDWKTYSEEAKKLPEINFKIDSFGKFYELVAKPEVFIKSVLNSCEKIEINLDNNEKLDIYKDVNIIFGGKGSGKTLLMNNYIVPKLDEMGVKFFIHEGKDYQKVYTDLLEKNINKVNIDVELKASIISDLNYILKYKENTPVDFIDKYLKYYKNQKVSKNASKIKKTECLYNKNESQTIDDLNIIYSNGFQSINKVDKINKNYRETENKHRKNLSFELGKLKTEIYETTIEKAKEIFSITKTNNLIENIKEIVDKKTGKKSKPNNLGFTKMVSERSSFFDRINNINSNLKELKHSERIKIGVLPDKDDIFIEVKIKVMDKEEVYRSGSPFDRNNIISNRKFIKKIETFCLKDLLNINTLFESDELRKNGNDYFNEIVKKDYEIVLKDGTIYNPSEGEKSILSISGFIEDLSYDFYLFDELERGLGNKYISEYIIPRLNYLRDIGKTIVISTHNANLAVSTLPIHTIYCNYTGNTDADIYFSGNMYSNELISIKNNGNQKKWDKEAIEHLEGSEIMFGVRRNIWN